MKEKQIPITVDNEDFAYYQKFVPGAFFNICTKSPDTKIVYNKQNSSEKGCFYALL